jgi:hypothetical protein
LLTLSDAQVILKFRVQRCFDRNFSQHLPELVEVILALDVFGCRLSHRL